MDQLKVKDRILENISLSVKKLQSYFAACEDETPAIRNHDRVLQRLCEHLDHALLYLQDISSGYWVLVVHFTRREAVRQIDELQHIATNLGRRAWLYLALSESSLESYLRLFQENQGLLQKYYFNALVCSHDHLTLFLTLVSGLEFIRFDLELDVPYLDVAPYMPEYYKPHNLLDFEERLPSSDSLSLHSFTSLTSTNLEWDDSAIAPSSEYDFGDMFPVLQSLPSADWEGDLTDQASCPRSAGSDPQTVISDTAAVTGTAAAARLSPHSPTSRHNPFNEDSDTNTSADATPVHAASRRSTTGDEAELNGNELEVIRMAKRKKPGKKRRGRGSTDSSSSIHTSLSSEPVETNHSNSEDVDSINSTVVLLDSEGEQSRSRVGSAIEEEGGEEGSEGLLRLPEMTDTSMDAVGRPLSDVMERLNGSWDQRENTEQSRQQSSEPPAQQPFRKDSEGKPPDPAPGETFEPSLAERPGVLHTPPVSADLRCFTPSSPDAADPSGGHHDAAEHGQSQALSGSLEDGEEEEEAPAGQKPAVKEEGSVQEDLTVAEETQQREKLSPSEISHPAEFVDNNHLLLLMIHVFRENEEQLFRWFLSVLKSAMVQGCREPPYPAVLTDATMEKLALNKFVSQESHCEVSEVSIQLYSLVHWEDPMDMTVSPQGGTPTSGVPSSTKEGPLLYRSGTRYLGKEMWKSCYVVLMVRMSTGHMEGDLQPLYLLLTDCYIYLLRKAAEKPYTVEDAVSYNELDYLSVGLDQQTVTLVCTNRRRKFLLDTADGSLTNGILYIYSERIDVTPLLSVTMGEHCGGCRRSNNTERPHAFQVILTDRPPLVLSANDEQDMAEWMQLLCQSVSKGVIPQGVAPTPCIPCCLVVTDSMLLTCHQDCQTSFFRSLGSADICDVTAVSIEPDKEYCVIEFAADRTHFLPPWVLYFSGCEERDRLLEALDKTWKDIFQQVDLPHRELSDPLVQKRCGDALELMKSAWQRADSLARGRAQREPWC
uniref:Pleckstrin homology domain-containing family M member 2 n=1 Tax=Fundulus heteroclitus TaxID=8078 RepID=A0A3Q2T941_FUNHE